MSTQRTRLISGLGLAVGLLLLGACTHKPDASQELSSALSPFTQSREESVRLVIAAKHSLGPADLNTLAASYAALEGTANGYASFIAEAARSESFDPGKNDKQASALVTAITAFNKSFSTISPANQRGQTVSSAWVPAFSADASAYWNKYHDALAGMSPQTKADLVKSIQKDMVWPNYENIATEAISVQRQ